MTTSDRVFRIGLLAVAALFLAVLAAVAYRSTHLDPRSKFFAPAPVTRIDGDRACVLAATVPTAREICFPTSMVDSSPWTSAGTTWHPTRSLAVGDCVSLQSNQDDLDEVRAVRWLGVTDCGS